MPFFSIVIPVFNRSDLFVRTLETIALQRFSDFEVIVIDDGSEPEMSRNIREACSRYPFVSYHFQENGERGRARNNGIRLAAGRYVVLFDSDDAMHAEHLDVLHSRIAALQDPPFLATKFDFVSGSRHFPSDIMKLEEGRYDYRLLLKGNPFACNICFRKDHPRLQLFEEDRGYASLEDWMFLLQNLRNDTLFLVDEVTISMNHHDRRSMTSNNRDLVVKAERAYTWMVDHVALSRAEQRTLFAQIHYFAAIHCYLDGDTRSVFRHLRKALHASGFRPRYAALAAKSLIGRKRLLKLKA
jgi:glycosyltransferase involved in cell wall biosynthesis